MTPSSDFRAGRLAWLRSVRRGPAGWPSRTATETVRAGAITGGGVDAPTVVATTLDQLRAAVERPEPLWIIARPSAGGRLREPLRLERDNKTIIAPEGLTLTGYGLRFERVMNVIVHGVSAVGVKGDAFEISSSHVVLLSDCRAEAWTDGAFDVVRGSGAVTLLKCTAQGGGKAKKGCLIGASDQPFVEDLRGTAWHHLGVRSDLDTEVALIGCWFRGVQVRDPLARYALVYLINHHVEGGGKAPKVESRTRARVMWLSGSATGDVVVAATSHGPDARVPGLLYVSPQVKLNGKVIEGATWTPSGDELAWAATQ